MNVTFGSYGYNYYGQGACLDEWCGIKDILFSKDYNIYPGITKETFFEHDDFEYKRSGSKYIWSNHTIKKKPKNDSNKIIFGCSPFCYAEEMIDAESPIEEKYEVVFLPRSDYGVFLNSNNKIKFVDYLFSINLKNPIFISHPNDLKFWSFIKFEDFSKKLYCIGESSLDRNWTYKLIKLLKKSSCIYNPIFSSNVVYSSFMGKKNKFYNEFSMHISYKSNKIIDNRTFVKSLKSERWNNFMNYLEEVFSDDNLTDDKKFFIYQFLSLDLIKTPNQLLEDLNFLSEKEYDMIFLQSNDRYENLMRKSKKFVYSNPSNKTLDFYEDL